MRWVGWGRDPGALRRLGGLREPPRVAAGWDKGPGRSPLSGGDAVRPPDPPDRRFPGPREEVTARC